MDSVSKSAFEKKRNEIEKTLTDEEINTLLEDYIEVDDPTTIELDTHVRYFTIVYENNKAIKIFRLGGKLFSISPDNDYVILKHGNNIIQANIENTIFYKQLSITEIKQEYETILDKYEDEIMELKQVNRQLYDKLVGKNSLIKSGRSDKEQRRNNKMVDELKETKVKKSLMKTIKISSGKPFSKMELSESNKQIRL